MNIHGKVDPGKAVMVAYAAISIGDVLIGFISQWLKSRKKSLFLFHIITALAVVWYFNLHGQSATMVYVVARFPRLWNWFLGNVCYDGGRTIRHKYPRNSCDNCA